MIDRGSVEQELAIEDRVLAEVDIYGRTVSFRTVIVKICPDELWLGMASPDYRLDGLRENHTLQVTVARAGAALLGQSGFLRPLGGGKSRVFAVVRPGSLERVQRRAHIRYQTDVPIHFRHLDPANREPRGEAASGVTLNVSPGGLLFQTDAAPQLGEELGLALPLSGGDRVSTVVRAWFDKLDPFSRIEVLSMLQANMAGIRVAGAAEPASVRPLTVALRLLGS